MSRKFPIVPALILAVAAAAVLVVLYVKRPSAVHDGPPAALAALKPDAAPVAVPDARFVDAQGRKVGLSAFRGHMVILNLWATWCAPCVRELPALSRLAAALGGGGVEIVAVNAGHDDAQATAKFLKDHAAANLGVYRDPGLDLMTSFGSQGLPFTVLIDAQGREIARATGPMQWDDPAAIAYFRARASSQTSHG